VLRRILDTDPDLSWIGDFGREAKSEFAIDHHEAQGIGEYAPKRTFQYFNPGSIDKGNSAAENRKYAKQDYERMMAYERQGWCMVGVRAEAQTMVSLNGNNSWKLDKLTSGGLWGVESDASPADFQEIADEQLSELADILLAYGFSKQQVSRAIKSHEEASEA
ncbi:hypothetical protein LCGC14_0892260, partial [marine sediment metagenome]